MAQVVSIRSALKLTSPSIFQVRLFSTNSTRPSAKQLALNQRSFSLRLYRAIMRTHRVVLPQIMRELGDSYVRDEFKRHKTAKPEFLNSFFEQWLNYLTALRSQQPGQLPELQDKHLNSFNDEQLQQLKQLREETQKAARMEVDLELAQSKPIDPVDTNSDTPTANRT